MPDSDTRRRLRSELDLGDAQSISYFGSKAQRALARVTQRMMKLATAAGPARANADLDQMLNILRAFKPDTSGGLLGRLFGSRRRRLLREVAVIVNRIDAAAASLERRKTELLTEVISFDRMIEQCREALVQVAHYEAVGRQVLGQAVASRDPGSDDLLARCEDLSVAHLLAQQTLATLLVAQQASQQLLSRVGAVLDQTLPAWQVHMSQLLSMWRGDQTVEALQDLSRLHGDMDEVQLRMAQARKAVSEELSSGRRDADALAVANEALSQAVGESVALAKTASQAVSDLKSPGP